MIHLLIADDHSVVREGVKHILSDMPEAVITEAANGQQVLDAMQKKEYDLVLLDIAMPGKDGLDVLRDIKRKRPHIKVLILSMFPEEQYALRALKSGASGYLTKESIPEELIKAIRKVIRGGKYISSDFSDKILSSFDDDAEKPVHESLSNREYQVMRMIASGKTLSEIADELFLSVKTVSTYRTRILEKMNLKNNAEIMHYAVKNGLVE
ncbi:MAG: response regulator transcription factor [Nitrospirota bacterium]